MEGSRFSSTDRSKKKETGKSDTRGVGNKAPPERQLGLDETVAPSTMTRSALLGRERQKATKKRRGGKEEKGKTRRFEEGEDEKESGFLAPESLGYKDLGGTQGKKGDRNRCTDSPLRMMGKKSSIASCGFRKESRRQWNVRRALKKTEEPSSGIDNSREIKKEWMLRLWPGVGGEIAAFLGEETHIAALT